MNRQDTVLIVDDEKDLRENIAEYLSDHGFRSLMSEDGASALELLHTNPIDVALVDLIMPHMSGTELLTRIRQESPSVQVIMITGKGTIETAVDAMRRGAFDYIAKPLKLSEMELLVRRACDCTGLMRRDRAFQEEQRRRRVRIGTEIVAHSACMRKILEEAEQAAAIDLPVLLEGETGVGKGIVAEFIHASSSRRESPLTVIECAALAENLVESELFGHEKGAFTGATVTRAGMLEIADRGTLLLDEIGDMPLTTQSRLLRFLERGCFRPLGGRAEKAVDVRVLAATNRDLAAEVKKGSFREDVYHRLHVLYLRIPPLRERTEDIVALAEVFLSRIATKLNRAMTIGEGTRAALESYAWPGNVRELSHTIERAAITATMMKSDEIAPVHLRFLESGTHSSELISLEHAQLRHVCDVLARVGGSRQKAAEVLGVSERHLYRLLKATRRAE